MKRKNLSIESMKSEGGVQVICGQELGSIQGGRRRQGPGEVKDLDIERPDLDHCHTRNWYAYFSAIGGKLQ
jgi:hypothetical protein